MSPTKSARSLKRNRILKYFKIPEFCTNQDFDHFCGHFLTNSPCPLGYSSCIFLKGDRHVHLIRAC